LLEAMKEAGRVAIARVVIRNKEQLVAIRPSGEVLTMSTMNFADEVVSPEAIEEIGAQDGDKATATKRELNMAQQLIDSLTAEFEPSKYHDTYRERVLELIERKAAGEEIAVAPEAPEPAAVPDLMAALEASLQEAKGKERKTSRRKAPAKQKKASGVS
ncbi:MAG: Ku protein, partial [Solirubrobacterales bacterium]